MNKNSKIAIGCGAVGCLGLIVLGIAGGAFYYWRSQQAPERTSRSIDINLNSNSNSNQTGNTNENENSGSSNSSSDGPAGTYTDDEKHKLFQAASMSQDADLVQRVVKKVGLFKADGTPADDYAQFIRDHITWGVNNASFIASLDTPEKARAYVEAHL
jgi:hypothetical protein